MDKHEYIDAFIAERLCDCNDTELRRKIVPLLREVLLAAWDDTKDRLHELRVYLINTSCYIHWPTRELLLHGEQMHHGSEWGIRYVIARELAHFMLRGGSEKEADEYVEKWGFKQDMLIYRGSSVHDNYGNGELYRKVKPFIEEVLAAASHDIKDRLHELNFVTLETTKYKHWPAHTILLYSGHVSNYSEHGMRNVIAHELGHFFLRHTGGASDRTQKEADECVEKWGFGEDMRIFRSRNPI